MRVLHVISGIDPRLGGTAAVVAGLAAAQTQAGVEVNVATQYAQDTDRGTAESLRARGIPVTEIGTITGRRGHHPDMPAILDRLVPHADIVHIHGLWEEIQHFAAAAARRYRRPYLVAPHGMLDPWSLRQSRWKKRLYLLLRLRRHLDQATALHFTSEEERDRTAALGLGAPSIVEPNGIDLREFDALPPRGTARARHNIPPGLAVLFLGRLHPKKGLDLLIPAFARAALDNATLIVAGPPDSDAYAAKLRQLVRDSNLDGRVIFTGMLRGVDRLALLADADLFVLPSRQENFGVAVAEALACGTPALLSDQVNIHRDIASARVGGVFPLDPEALARQLKRWGTDEALRHSAAERAAPFARARYDWNAIARRWLDHYSGIIERSAPTPRTIAVGGAAPAPAAANTRILHVIAGIDPRLGGTANLLMGLTAAQARAGLDVSVATLFSPGDNHAAPAEALRSRGVRVTEIGPTTSRLFNPPGLTRTMDELIRRADVVHIHALWEPIQHVAAHTAHALGVPYIIAPQGMLDPWSLRQNRWMKRLYMLLRLRRHLNNAAAIQFTADLERDLTAPLRLRAPAIIEPNGIDLTEYEDLPAPGAARQRHNVPPGLMLLFLSRLHPKKGLDLLIPAFARARLPDDVTLVIAGPDSDGYEAKIRRLVRDHGLEQRVMFTGMLYGKDRLALMADADLFVLPSYQENFGIVVAESLACGTPVLISDGINIYREIQQAGVGGVCKPEVESVAAELKRWGSDAELRCAAAAKAARFARQRYDWNAIARRWRQHYAHLVAQTARSIATVPVP